MREIEVKAKVSDFKALIGALEKLGCKLSEPIVQKDIIFSPIAANVLRIRRSGDRSLFTLKRSVANELDSIEREVEISDPKIMNDIIEFLGYKEMVRVNKVRKVCRYKEYEICLDEVEDLGSFIEVEKMSDEDGEKVQKELFDFLRSLGVDPSQRVMMGYDTMMFKRNHL